MLVVIIESHDRVCLVLYRCTNFGPVRSGLSPGPRFLLEGLWLPKLKYTNLAASQNSRSGPTLKTHRLWRPAIQTDPDRTIQIDPDLWSRPLSCGLQEYPFSKVVAAKGPAGNQICFRVYWLCVLFTLIQKTYWYVNTYLHWYLYISYLYNIYFIRWSTIEWTRRFVHATWFRCLWP